MLTTTNPGHCRVTYHTPRIEGYLLISVIDLKCPETDEGTQSH
jgi:hypothetical protein